MNEHPCTAWTLPPALFVTSAYHFALMRVVEHAASRRLATFASVAALKHQPKQPARASSAPAATPGRRWALRLAAALSPLVVLVLLELGLRWGGYGYPTSFFLRTEVAGKPVYIENEKFGWRFFPPTIARSPTPTSFPATKAAGTYRVFVFGESAALGDPRPAYGFGRYLEVLLRERFPEGRFEVIPAAMTAINSHGLLPIARQCAGLEGDLWIIYAGNNEMEGPFGVTNPFGMRAPATGWVRVSLAFKATRIGQWLGAQASRWASNPNQARNWAGMKTMAETPVSPLDPARETVYRSFERNLEDIVRLGVKSGASVVLATVGSNLRECPPFASASNPKLSPADRNQWSNLCAQADAATEARDPAKTAGFLKQALALDELSAENHFRLGHCHLALTNETEARAELARARDLDALPFRADSRLNQIAQAISQRQAGPRVKFFDAEAVLGEGVKARAPGSETFYEHVHLNFDGNYRLARALAGSVEELVPPALKTTKRPEWATPDLCARRLGLSDWNRFAVYESVLSRIQDAPFTNQIDHARHVRMIQARMAELRPNLQPPNYMDARAVYEESLARMPGDFRLHENFAEFLESIGELAEARQHWEKVRDAIPHHCLPYYQVGRLASRLGTLPAAEADLTRALALRPDFPEARLELGQVYARQKQFDRAIAEYRAVLAGHPDTPAAYLRLADALATQGKRADATATLQESIRIRPNQWEARFLLGVELAAQDKVKEAGEQFSEVVRLRPDFALGHLNYAIALAKQGQINPAAVHFRETIRLDPANTKAAEYLRTLEAAARAATGGGASSTNPPAR